MPRSTTVFALAAALALMAGAATARPAPAPAPATAAVAQDAAAPARAGAIKPQYAKDGDFTYKLKNDSPCAVTVVLQFYSGQRRSYAPNGKEVDPTYKDFVVNDDNKLKTVFVNDVFDYDCQISYGTYQDAELSSFSTIQIDVNGNISVY
jgi:hypothetical protein